MSEINKERIEKLRSEMRKEGIAYYIVPTDDYHISEYVGDFFKCREYMSGFTGSAGTLLVGLDDAYQWTDGRYFLQAAEELKGSGVKLMRYLDPGVPDLEDFLKDNAKDLTIGYDGRTMAFSVSKVIKNALKDNNIKYVTDKDLVDRVWVDRPKMSDKPIWIFENEYTGCPTEVKLDNLKNELKKEKLEAMVVTALDEVAWLYNFRGDDVLYTPVSLAFSIVTQYGQTLYIDLNKLNDEVKSYFKLNGISLKEYNMVYEDLKKIDGTVLVDPNSTNEEIVNSIGSYKLMMSPIKKAKAIKNEIEIENEKKAHLKDGVALTKEIYRIKKMALSGEIYKESELSIGEHLNSLRAQQKNFISLSFENIVGSTDHGAIIHYEPTPETNKNIEEGFLLIDSGGQYLEGTTDVTRTISVGKVDRTMKLRYTAVLKGHIDLGLARFPEGTLGNSLEVLARRPIWQLGLDFNHGTGHGVGMLLGVHEGPNAIRRQILKAPLSVPMEEGMITSDEPGIYLENEYGIRIENLFLCKRIENESFKNFLEFEMLTLVPYDKASINFFDLNEDELSYLRAYNARLVKELSPYLTDEENAWLKEETDF